MINVYVTDAPNTIYKINESFRILKQTEWFSESFIQNVIRGIDNTEVEKGECLISPVFGAISPEQLSTGCKAVILMCKTDYPIYATRCGDNCVPYIEELSNSKNLNLVLHHCMLFSDGVKLNFAESGKEVQNREEFVTEFYKLRDNLCKL